jgi:hypothetical protein
MAQSDANEQIKEILRQLIKHRFWIAIGFACLFAVIAYFMGSGPVQAKAKTEIDAINNAEKGVKAYATPNKPTDAYRPIVEEKTGIMGNDVNKAWKELYVRQAPLLTWPERVKNRIGKWGREYPKDQASSTVQIAIVDYIEAYPEYVDMVYKTFDPFDYETGKGIVASPGKEALLRPVQFSVEGVKYPSLGKIWAAQERLWVQRTLLEVIRQVNRQAKDWDTAIVREITGLEVGNSESQDQRSLAKGEQLTKAGDILSPEQEAAAAASATDSGGGGGVGGAGTPMAPGMSGGRGMMEMMMGGRMGGARGVAQSEEGIYYITPADDKGQYKILPVLIRVLVDQDHVQDLLVELENSPMSIQVKDFELERPASPVTKPEKGEERAGMGMMGMMGGGMMMRQMMGGRAYGGMARQMEQMQEQMMMYRMGGAQMPGGMRMPGAMGQMGGGSPRDDRKKVDVRNIDRAKERKQREEELAKRKGTSLVDPYFNIVQVTVYGQARFYNPPPAEPEAQPSPGDVAASPATPAAPSESAPAPGATAGGAAAPDKAAAPAPAVKDAPPGAAADATKSEPGAANPPEKPAAEKPADAKPAAPAADTPKPDNQGAAPKR